MKKILSQPFIVVGAAIEQDGKFLLVQENWGVVKGLWNTPAGWLDMGENPLLAVAREVKEETGFDFTPSSLLGVYSSVKAEGGVEKHPIKLVFKGEISGKPSSVDKAEISEARWFSADEIYAMDDSKLRDVNIRQIVKDYVEGKDWPLELISHSSYKS